MHPDGAFKTHTSLVHNLYQAYLDILILEQRNKTSFLFFFYPKKPQKTPRGDGQSGAAKALGHTFFRPSVINRSYAKKHVFPLTGNPCFSLLLIKNQPIKYVSSLRTTPLTAFTPHITTALTTFTSQGSSRPIVAFRTSFNRHAMIIIASA